MEKHQETMALENIIPYENNPRLNEAAVAAVAESIAQCGYISPIVVDEDNIILAGHTRHKALKRLGYTVAPVIVCEGLTEEQKRKFRILDNKTGELAEWDWNKLALEIEGLDFNGFDFRLEEQQANAEDFGDEFELPDGDKPEMCTMSFNLKEQQWDLIQSALDLVKGDIGETFGNVQERGNALYTIAKQWNDMKGGSYGD